MLQLVILTKHNTTKIITQTETIKIRSERRNSTEF